MTTTLGRTLCEPNPTGPGVAAPLNDSWSPRSTHTSELEKFIGHVLQWRFKFHRLLRRYRSTFWKWAPKEGLRQFEGDVGRSDDGDQGPENSRDRHRPWSWGKTLDLFAKSRLAGPCGLGRIDIDTACCFHWRLLSSAGFGLRVVVGELVALFLLGPSDQRRDVGWLLGLKSVADVEDGVAGVTNQFNMLFGSGTNKKPLLTLIENDTTVCTVHVHYAGASGLTSAYLRGFWKH